MGDLKDCDTCSNPFVADEGWKKQCVVCWKADKDYKLGVGDKAFQAMQAAYIELRDFSEQVAQNYAHTMDELESMGVANKRLTRLLREKRKELQAEKAKKAPPPPPPPAAPLSQEQVRALIKLCHPDRHSGSEAATKMTQWLLSLRRKE
jgi:hypothetical protein